MVSNKFYLGAPLDIEGWEVVETLERFTLYDEFVDRIDDALEVIRQGQEHWLSHQTNGKWSVESVRVLAM